MKYNPPTRIGWGENRHLFDLSAAIRRGDIAAADAALTLLARDGSVDSEAIALGRASVHARPRPERLRAAA